jgi:hypothetical protein
VFSTPPNDKISAPKPRLPDLTIWDSIRVCATAALENLVKTIEIEISKDQSLAELRTTGSARMAMESRARQWTVRAYELCKDCWLTRQQKEETIEFRTAVYFYGLSPFFSEHVLRLLRLAAGMSPEIIRRVETERKPYYSAREGSALHNASEVYTKLMSSWMQDLPPISKPAVVETPQPTLVVSKAPRPPHALSGTGGWSPPTPKPVELPPNFPPSFPASLALKARVILADLVREFPERSKIEQFCNELVSRYAELLCTAVRSGILKAHVAPEELSTIVHYVLVSNCEGENERFEIQRKVINSDQWHAMLKRLLECEEELEAKKDKPAQSEPDALDCGTVPSIHGMTDSEREEQSSRQAQIADGHPLSLRECAACGHYECHHDDHGCFLDQNGKSSQDPGFLHRSALKKMGTICWCLKFTTDFSQAVNMILESGNSRALKQGTETAIAGSDSQNAQRLLDQLIMKTSPGARDLEWIKAVERRISTIALSVTTTPSSTKPTRGLVRSADFVSFAGNLWLTARGKSPNGTVTPEQLKQIASSLDEQQYLPPAKYLERKASKALREFNSKNSHSKIGSIQTWSRMVEHDDKDHLRDMRRLLSRCANKDAVALSAVRSQFRTKNVVASLQ